MLERSQEEESNAKCNICASGLSYVEHTLHGNRCLFCVTQGEIPARNISRIPFIFRAYWDWKIYQEIVQVWREKGHDKAKFYFIACIGHLGFTDINQIKTLKQKRELCRLIRSGVKHL